MFVYSRIASESAPPYRFRMSLNLNIRSLRKAKKMTLADLAGKIGVSVPHLSEVERGRKNLNNHLMERLAEALGVPPSTLISDEAISDLEKLKETAGKLEPDDLERLKAFAEALLFAEQGSKQS